MKLREYLTINNDYSNKKIMTIQQVFSSGSVSDSLKILEYLQLNFNNTKNHPYSINSGSHLFLKPQ